MKILYLIHFLGILEIILAIYLVQKIQNFIANAKKVQKKFKKRVENELKKLETIRNLCKDFNYKYENKKAISIKLGTKLITQMLLRGIISKTIISKGFLLPKLLKKVNVLFWFVLSFWIFKNKTA